MANWTTQDLNTIGAAEEVRVAATRPDGTLRNPVTVWIVRVGDDLYVRSVNGRSAAWFRGVLSRPQGRIWAPSAETDVTFDEVQDRIQGQIDAAYREKYRRYPSIVPSILTAEARTATLKLVRRELRVRKTDTHANRRAHASPADHPVVVAIAVPRLTRKFGNACLLAGGLLLTLLGMASLSRPCVEGPYLTGVALPMVLIGRGQGASLSPLTASGITGVAAEDAGAASGLVNVAHQLGGSLGLGIHCRQRRPRARN